jgi:hypothetical protein
LYTLIDNTGRVSAVPIRAPSVKPVSITEGPPDLPRDKPLDSLTVEDGYLYVLQSGARVYVLSLPNPAMGWDRFAAPGWAVRATAYRRNLYARDNDRLMMAQTVDGPPVKWRAIGNMPTNDTHLLVVWGSQLINVPTEAVRPIAVRPISDADEEWKEIGRVYAPAER